MFSPSTPPLRTSRLHRILVLGGSGFIGGHVIQLLRARGYEPTIFDRSRRPRPETADVPVFLGDVKDAEAVDEAVRVHDGVINLAGLLGTAETVITPDESVAVNILGALHVYQAIRRNGKPCVQITVGNWQWNNPYAITKYAAERFAFMYNQEFRTEIAVIRGLNAYGPGQKAAPIRKVVPNFVLRALRNEPIEIFGDGLQLLDMIYVGDLAELLVRGLEFQHGCYDRTMEAGSGDPITCRALAEAIIRIAGSRSELRFLPPRPGEPVRSVTKADVESLRPLGPITMTPIEEGLRQTIDWYRTHATIWQMAPPVAHIASTP